MTAGTHVSVVPTEDSHPSVSAFPSHVQIVLGDNVVLNFGCHPDPAAYLEELIEAAHELTDLLASTAAEVCS